MEQDYAYEDEVIERRIRESISKLDGDLPTFSPVCRLCRHLYCAIVRTCAAYPRGIPDEIWLGEHDHKTPFPGDYGIRFSPRSLFEEDVAPRA